MGLWPEPSSEVRFGVQVTHILSKGRRTPRMTPHEPPSRARKLANAKPEASEASILLQNRNLQADIRFHSTVVPFWDYLIGYEPHTMGFRV